MATSLELVDVNIGVLGNNSIQIGYKLSLDTLVLIIAVFGAVSTVPECYAARSNPGPSIGT